MSFCHNHFCSAVPKPECVEDKDCSNDKACLAGRCLNPCHDNPSICGVNAECHVQLHRPVCTCRNGFTGHAQHVCYESEYQYYIKNV